MIHLDTSHVLWLHQGEVTKLSSSAVELIETEELVVSPMVIMELTFLHEIGRWNTPATRTIAELDHLIGLRTSTTPWAAAVRAAAGLSWTRDPFDRLIVGDALASGARLLTRDVRILEHCPVAVS